MAVSPKPAGYSSVSPYLMVVDAQRVIDFLKQVFDAVELRRYPMPDGSIMHAEVRIGDTVIMLADAAPQKSEAGSSEPSEFSALPAWIHVYVPDVDQTYRRALATGAVSVQEPQQKEGDSDRRGGVKDSAGNIWWIASQVSESEL